jgi:hypothetical protein
VREDSVLLGGPTGKILESEGGCVQKTHRGASSLTIAGAQLSKAFLRASEEKLELRECMRVPQSVPNM